ncbi:TlpA disulfide reductase family protein [Aureibaculum sp. 2210JD6-5]|uniref:TlpA family protein disulfide reductase n=1 Tax=Aureibaculum sp. 2210JD6-5 TaxID=3103957 RepID=UPI002AAEBDFA|nr:TlpA disulfide reductase family protein [Aureibaculum sp. 2210JD6-5]MDY7395564.1 TlpA disulfide reductase family protein [Aureibaculum sp. 2210JD6-5]
MKFNRKTISNILFFGFIIFLFTPFGLGTRAKFTQGFAYVKSFMFTPSVAKLEERTSLDTYNVSFKGIVSANDTNLESLKGNVVFINYWATWCPPCIAEMPMIKSLYRDYKDKIEFLFVTNEDQTKVARFYKKHDYDFPTYNAISKLPQQIDYASLPTTYILDKNGKVALLEYGAANWNSDAVRNLLDKLIKE